MAMVNQIVDCSCLKLRELLADVNFKPFKKSYVHEWKLLDLLGKVEQKGIETVVIQPSHQDTARPHPSVVSKTI